MMNRLPLPVRILLGALALVLLSLSGCATVKTCTQPLTGQVIDDGSAVLACVAKTGQSLAACEQAQLSVEAGQLTADALMCGEQAISVAYTKGTHVTVAK